jgi:hypothetical protein
VSQVAERLPSKHEVLTSNPKTPKKEKKRKQTKKAVFQQLQRS